MKVKSIIFFIVSLVLSSSLLRADKLYLRNGDILRGTFMKIEKEFYAFKTEEGFVKYIPQDEVDDMSIGERQALALRKK